jgi:Domain of unknown function (DUF6089)
MLHLRLLQVLFITVIISNKLKAQNYLYHKYYDNALVFELGATGGLINAFTDLGGKKGIGRNFIKDLRWQTARPAAGIYLLANYNEKICLRFEGTMGQVVGYDSILKTVSASTFGRYERNLSFRSNISELQVAVEIHYRLFKNNKAAEYPLLSPYIIGGAGLFTFDPEAQLNGYWYRLQPLRLEGQGFKEYNDRKPYKLTQLNLVTGVGIKYRLSNFFNARLEVAHRKLFTDYLDDVSTTFINPSLFTNYLSPAKATLAKKLYTRTSEILPNTIQHSNEQRGDARNNDSYFTILFKIGITLGRQKQLRAHNSGCNLVDL